MPIIKIGCRYIPRECDDQHHLAARRDWETHPSWITGMEALEDYQRWVSEVVLPIAFQWIEEHKPEVYANVPEELKDDVGVVIAAAFALVKDLSAYRDGLDRCESYQAAVRDGSWDPSATNPVWTGLTQRLRAGTREIFAKESRLGEVPGHRRED